MMVCICTFYAYYQKKKELYWSCCPYNLVLEHSQTIIYCQELSSIRTLLLVKPNFVHYVIHILSMLVMCLHLMYKSSLCIPQWGTASFLKLGFSFSFSCWTLSSMLNMKLFINFSQKKKTKMLQYLTCIWNSHSLNIGQNKWRLIYIYIYIYISRRFFN